MLSLLHRALIILALVACSLAAVATPAQAAPAVTGTVTDPMGNTASGTALLYEVGSGNGGGNSFAGGTFTVNANHPGDYQLQLRVSSMDDYARWYVAGQPAGSVNRADATVLHFDGSTLVSVDAMQFPAIATLQGTVTNGDGDPMAGITVHRNRLGMGSSRITDADGHYDFGYVQAGLTVLSVNATGGWAGASDGLTVGATGDNVVDLVLAAPSHIGGVITDATTGKPAPWLYVEAYRMVAGTPQYVTSSRTTPLGHYDLDDLGEGDYVVKISDDYLQGYDATFNGAASFQAATPTPVAGGSDLTYDQAMAAKADPRPNRSLSGLVTDAATPANALFGIVVEAVSSDGSVAASTMTDRSGRWGLDVPDGDYTVRAQESPALMGFESQAPWFPESYPDAWGASGATTITVNADQHPDLDMVLARSARLHLMVSSGGSTDVNAGYRLVEPDGSVVFTQDPAPGVGNQIDVLMRPGTWKVLVTGEKSDGTPVLAGWLDGAASLAKTQAVVAVEGLDESWGVSLPGHLEPTRAPRIRGKAKVGKKLTATKGTWNLMTGTTFTFTWMRGTKVVGHKSSRVVVNADRGKRLKVRVTATNGSFSTTRTLTVTVAR